jgi:hypothetical protein
MLLEATTASGMLWLALIAKLAATVKPGAFCSI